ncbi:hypothetical protein MC7420_7669 [Coleofasciculus chthonoplastes PCC 7420]|uniref:Uncharacterized protein n=1 Tax=Coleofasciculus chthonoplastes PCC 7420 TaxID=118168 RepID=B4VJH7_9CYAN|nr:hypothetical protein MC7420_7669 [Coleofasciculus chthonoplastes PCC 7420]
MGRADVDHWYQLKLNPSPPAPLPTPLVPPYKRGDD